MPDRSEPLVTVLTPVYNGEPYLEQCIESVLAQTYRNWTYTIVNNCSTDRSLQIAQSWASRDGRITVIDNESFLDQVPNLNRAMSSVGDTSRYTKMVLADDWIYPGCLEQMVRVAESSPRVGLVGSHCREEDAVTCTGLEPPDEVFDGREVCRRSLLAGVSVFGSPNNLLVRSEIVRQRVPFFSESSLHEDTESCFEILETWDWGFVHEPLTFTRRQNESLTAARRAHDGAHCLDRLLIARKFGPRLLSGDEYDRCLREAEDRYYRFLADRLLYRTSPGFWEYHRNGLAGAGATLDRWRLTKYLGGAIGRELREPGRIGRRLRNVLSRSRPGAA